jgi:CheY-like chemotaxis protein
MTSELPATGPHAALRRVLLADDDPFMRLVAKIGLERYGRLETLFTDSGDDVLELARNWHPDLIVLDVIMPGVDGPAALAALRRDPDTSAIPVVFLTTRVLSHEVARYLRLGVTDVISKPFSPVDLSRTLSDIWARTQAQTGGTR